MNESATKGSGDVPPPSSTRSARMQKTRLAITSCSRELTAEHGFSGFTIEELCSRVGISRRTFFNYFPSKLDAVFGHDEDGLSAESLEQFMNARPPGTVGISPTLLADLTTLVLTQLRRDEAEILRAHGFFEAVHREPELLAKLVQVGPERLNKFTAQVAEREGVDPSHPGLVMLVHMIQFAMHQAVQRYAAAGQKTSLEHEFLGLMRQTQQLLDQSLTPSPGPTNRH